MHAIAEIVIPQTADVPASIEQVMGYFKGEEGEDRSSWFDFWVIGGRYSGHKLEARIGQTRIAQFSKMLNEKQFTVSSFTMGKPDLKPASQIPEVDALWREWFPGCGEKCVFLSHYHDQYGHSGINPVDVCSVGDCPENLKCERLIIAGPLCMCDKAGQIVPKKMLATSLWNGVDWQDTLFDGMVKPKLAGLNSTMLLVTVDYHN
jgi:hypothetical protein